MTNQTVTEALLYHANGKNYKKMDSVIHKAAMHEAVAKGLSEA